MTTPDDPMSDPLLALRRHWLENGGQAPSLDVASVQRSARRLQRRVWRRNLSEWAAALLVVLWCTRELLRSEALLTRLGLLALALAALYVSLVLQRRGRVAAPQTSSTAEFLRAYRAALEQQARLLESVWSWYLLPFVPGVALTYAQSVRAALARGSAAHSLLWLAAAGLLFTAAVFVGVAALNRRAARGLRRELAALGED